MYALTLLAALSAFTAQTHAVPTAASTDGFTVQQVAVGKKLLCGAVEVQKTYQKFGKPVPNNVAVAAASATQSGTVKASPGAYDENYLCPVTVGSQTMNLDFDTGSSDLWVFSTLLPAKQSSGHSPLYNPATSGTKVSGETWNIAYEDGSGSKGVVYADKVVIGKVTATSQYVEAATSVSSQFTSDTANDGLVGLAFESINTCSPKLCPTFMTTVGPTLDSDLFTSYLKYHAVGSYDFGFINASKYSGSITYTSVTTSNGFWQFSVGGFAVGSTSHTSALGATIADTGTSLIYLPDNVVTDYYAKVSGSSNSEAAGGYIFPCTDTLPSLGVTISGVSHTVPGTYLNYAPYEDGQCFGGLQSSDGIGINVLGDVFLKSQFVVFDVGNTRIGFATQK